MNSSEQKNSSLNTPNEFFFHIEDVRFTLLTDAGMEYSPPADSAADRYVQPHFHSYYELFYVNKGTLGISLEDGDVQLCENDLIILSPKVPHRTLKSPSLLRYNINFCMEKNHLHVDFSLYDALEKILAQPYITVRRSLALHEPLRRLCNGIIQGNKFTLGLYFHEFVMNLLNVTDSIPKFAPVSDTLRDSDMRRIYKIHNIINLYYTYDISLEYIAESLFLSTRQVNRIIQQYYGCKYRELIAEMRMKAAANFLSTTNLTVSEISSQVGYNSIRGFYGAFKKHFGCLPTQYRKKAVDA